MFPRVGGAAVLVVVRSARDGADMGTARAARAIEPLCQLWCILGFRENRWTDHAFHLLQR
jgi:hypothetical protein